MPAYVVVFLRFIAPSVNRDGLSQSAVTSREEELALRVDPQASDLRTRVGGWLLVIGADGLPDPSVSPWFAGEVREDSGSSAGKARLLA